MLSLPMARSPARRVLAPFAGVVLLRLLSALAPAEPLLAGIPLGLCLELGVVAASTWSLTAIIRTLLPPASHGAVGPGPASEAKDGADS